MSDFYTAAVRQSPTAQRHRRQKRMSKVAMMSGIIGWLGVVISVMLFFISQLYRNEVERRFLIAAASYLGAGFVCLVGQRIFQYMATRLATHGQPALQVEPFDARRRRRGGALILVLSVVAVVSMWLAYAQVRTAMTRRHNEGLLLRARLQATANEAVFLGLQRLADDEDLLCDHTNELWCSLTEWRDPSGISVRLQVSDENKSFDVNNLAMRADSPARPAAEIMADLMTLCGDFAPVDRVEALADWVDADKQGMMEEAFYAQQNRPPPSNRILYTWNEWLSVSGFDRDYFHRRERSSMYEPFKEDPASLFTILPRVRRQPTKVNVNTISLPVLMGILGLDREDAARMIIATRNKRPFRNLDELVGVIPQILPMVRPYLDVRSRFFTVYAQAYAQDRMEAVFALAERTAEGQIEIRHWVTM